MVLPRRPTVETLLLLLHIKEMMHRAFHPGTTVMTSPLVKWKTTDEQVEHLLGQQQRVFPQAKHPRDRSMTRGSTKTDKMISIR